VKVLQISGGKDSLACLYLLRPYWERIHVMWVNTGDAFPETIEQMASIKLMVPNFVEVTSDQPQQHAVHGYPCDLVPVWDTTFGRTLEKRQYKVQTPFYCCNENIWQPAMKAVRELGADTVIRGVRRDEKKTTPVKQVEVHDGITYLYPILDWSEQKVRDFLAERGVPLPMSYRFVNTSLDCMRCTGYLSENQGKFQYMKQHHPALHEEVRQRVIYLKDAADIEIAHMRAVIGDNDGV
jgi:phosphoadenosine phosphosulfate reductase